MARSDPGDETCASQARPASPRARRAAALLSDHRSDPLARPMPATTRLAEDPVLLPMPDGVAVRLPEALKPRFRRGFPGAIWNPECRLYLVGGHDARKRVEAWLARIARKAVAPSKAKAPPPLRLT